MSSTSPSPGASGTGSPPQPTQPPPGPPYPPTTAQLGLTPTPIPDIPISAALGVLFLAIAAVHIATFRRTRRRGAPFPFSAVAGAVSVSRAAALAVRCAWAAFPRSGPLALAAQLLASAGVPVLLVLNLALARRVLLPPPARRPARPPAVVPLPPLLPLLLLLFRVLFASAGALLVAVVTATVHGAFVADDAAREADRRVQLVCATCLAAYAFLPVVVVAWAARVVRRRVDAGVGAVGEGRFGTKVALLVGVAMLLTAGAVFRAAVAYAARPAARPAWFHSKACYYCFNCAIELVVVYAYALLRFDKRFCVPRGSSAPGEYSGDKRGVAGGSVTLTGDLEKGCAEEWIFGGLGGGAGELKLPPAPKTAPRVSSFRSVRRAARLASSNYGEGPSQSSLVVREDMRWMTKAMRALYGGDEEPQKGRWREGGWRNPFGDDYSVRSELGSGIK